MAYERTDYDAVSLPPPASTTATNTNGAAANDKSCPNSRGVLKQRSFPADRMPDGLLGGVGGWGAAPHPADNHQASEAMQRKSGSRKVFTGMGRQPTFQRQNSERRERLEPNPTNAEERRALSADRRNHPYPNIKRTLSPPEMDIVHDLAGPLYPTRTDMDFTHQQSYFSPDTVIPLHSLHEHPFQHREETSELSPAHLTSPHNQDLISERLSTAHDDYLWREDLDKIWILNLSMHFRDKSEREKFFVSFRRDDKWHRITVSCDYRDALENSLEKTLKGLTYQRDKSAEIYGSIRETLPDIKFLPTVTNLKLKTETIDGEDRLHVHVTEDVNEIIPFPELASVRHLSQESCPLYPEKDVHFEAHLSGFVYKVQVGSETLIRKDIPGLDTVEEFLYEVNALASLRDSKDVIALKGLVTDDEGKVVKGLLIGYAAKGALVDLIFEEAIEDNSPRIPMARREKWAKQIVRGLTDIHEAGYVQGDFTLSNIVIDKDDDAKIIDINRRGCPVGWEPPELNTLIYSGLRVAKYIGNKTDLFQLGMVLWGLAHQVDEPERQERPLYSDPYPEDVPEYLRVIIRSCLSDLPKDRLSAKELLLKFPATLPTLDSNDSPTDACRQSISTHRSDKQYIDPRDAVGLEDIQNYRHSGARRSNHSLGADTYGATSTRFDSTGSYIAGGERGRSQTSAGRRGDNSPYARPVSSATSYSNDNIDKKNSDEEGRRDRDRDPGLEWECVSVGDNGQRVRVRDADAITTQPSSESTPQQPARPSRTSTSSSALLSARAVWAEAGTIFPSDEGDPDANDDVDHWIDDLSSPFVTSHSHDTDERGPPPKRTDTQRSEEWDDFPASPPHNRTIPLRHKEHFVNPLHHQDSGFHET